MTQRNARRRAALLAAALLAALPAEARPPLPPAVQDVEARIEAAFEEIDEDEVLEHLAFLASPRLEGRDSPSAGLELAAEYIAGRFARAGLLPMPDAAQAWERNGGGEPPAWSRAEGAQGSYLRPFSVEAFGPTPTVRPVPAECALALELEGEEPRAFEYGRDFVPVAGCDGEASGELVFAGFAISAKSERYDDLRALDLRGKLALVLSGEPRHAKRFEGEEVTANASWWSKMAALEEAGAAAMLVVRRPPPEPSGKGAPKDGEESAPPPLGFRYTWAWFAGSRPQRFPEKRLPVLELSPACASALLGEDVLEIAARIDRSVRPVKVASRVPRHVRLAARTEQGPVILHNVAGWVPGSDPSLAGELVVVGAHYDHVGVGPRGRIGTGADDNASGTAAMLEIAAALAGAKPRRSVLCVAFAAEEDGLIGSERLAEDLPVGPDRVVAMVNLDMIGRGDAGVATVLGIQHNPDLDEVLRRARRLGRTGVRKVERLDSADLFQRSDHYSFHKRGIPTVFFMEDMPLATNREYHTWRDTLELVDVGKVTNTARLAFATAWILANDDSRPSAPRD